uniref:Uncharacterized protein n=1 Tax=Piliocolobus tephrosceles TaxID=591936 RepID=A0A8C9GL62_9PRIM
VGAGLVAEMNTTLFVDNVERNVTKELLFKLFHQVVMPRRISVCHVLSLMLQIQALPPHLPAVGMKGLWVTEFHQHRYFRDLSLLQKIFRDKQR